MAEPNSQLNELTRNRDRGGDLALLHNVFDLCRVATVSTVLGDEPWSVPMLVTRDHDRLLMHGSTGAGALRHIANGAKVCVSAFILDALVIADRQFDHSANYRSATVRGRCRVVQDDALAATLDRLTDAIVAGRSRECPPHSAKELAQTVLLELPIAEGMWVAKARSGPPAPGDGGWTGTVPVYSCYGQPASASDKPVPASIKALTART